MRALKTLLVAATAAMITTSASALTTFSWSDTPVSATANLTLANQSDLVLAGYSGMGSEATGFIMVNTDTGISFATATQFCDPAGGLFLDGCTLVTTADQVGDVLLAGLAPGNYTLGIFDSATPVVGSISFQIAAVPLPASVLLLLAALGLGGVMRKRSKAYAPAAA